MALALRMIAQLQFNLRALAQAIGLFTLEDDITGIELEDNSPLDFE